jgi:hypothetical protein
MVRRVRSALFALLATTALLVPSTAIGASTKTCEEEGVPHKKFTTTYTQKSACPSESEVGKTAEKASNQGGNEPPGQQP